MSTPTLLSAPKLLAFPLRREDVPVVRNMSQEGETLDSLPDCDDEAFKALTARGTSSYLVRSGTGEKLGALIVTDNGRKAPSVTNLVDDRIKGTFVERGIRRIQDDLACIRQSGLL